jgi:hypothetical protein
LRWRTNKSGDRAAPRPGVPIRSSWAAAAGGTGGVGFAGIGCGITGKWNEAMGFRISYLAARLEPEMFAKSLGLHVATPDDEMPVDDW